MDWSYIALIGEIFLDVAVLGLGALLMFRAEDNRLRMYWGLLSLLLAGLLLGDNISWLIRWPDELSPVMDGRLRFMSLGRMMKFYLIAHFFSLFPLVSLRPGWLTPVRLIMFSFPLLAGLIIAVSYIWFNGYFTPVDSLCGIFANLSHPDVQVRLLLFLLSIVTPTVYTFLPLVGIWRHLLRRMSAGMVLYFALWLVVAVSYISYTLNASLLLFSIFGYMVMLLPLVFSVLFLRQENPLSIPPDPDRENDDVEQIPVSPIVYQLSVKMSEMLKKEHCFTDQQYSIMDLAAQLNTRQSLVMDAVRFEGYTGFREYMISLRLEYFKTLAEECPGASVKEMMFRSGFTSRSSFYRQFAEQEKMSPKEYIDRLYRKDKPDL